ncbi:MAG: hypothetical protein M0015_07485 [Betaproteobacteria bacterium]|nr:hypothetical protein [Betaproteobacteria bacterium]
MLAPDPDRARGAARTSPLGFRDPVLLVPLDTVSALVLEEPAHDLAAKGFGVGHAPPAQLPASAYDRSRGRYRAELVMALMREPRGPRLLGVTERDLYAHGMNFVFGIADSPGRAALISLCRLRVGADADTLRTRALKEGGARAGA